GCASAPPFSPATPLEVRVPVDRPVYCAAAAPAPPALPVATLRADAGAATTMRSYAATVAILKGAVRERDALIAGCAAPPGGDKTAAEAAVPRASQ
ncbi:MAG: hypothetical protein ACREQT_15235, partial [Candidatus Binataceae bacterium]